MIKKLKWSSFFLLILLFLPYVASAAEPTVEEMAAHMLMVGFRGTEVSADSPIIRHIRAGHVGNVILFDRDLSAGGGPERNIHSPEQLKTLTKALRDAAPGVPLWIAIDQEGGKVQRLRPKRGFKENYPSAQELGKGDVSVTRATALRIGRELAEMGIDIDFAPVADVSVNPQSPAIGAIERSFSSDPYVVARHAEAFSDGLRDAGIIPCLKHFPGHGSAAADTHDGVVDVTLTWQSSELLPYRLLFRGGWQGFVMSAHVSNGKLDADYPASLSPLIMNGLLRNILGWNGVTVTDDLHMKALTKKHSTEEIIRMAVLAGADILILSGNSKDMEFDPEFPAKAHRALLNEVAGGTISRERLYESWQRIMKLKGVMK